MCSHATVTDQCRQVIVNIQTQSVEGLALPFLANWLFGTSLLVRFTKLNSNCHCANGIFSFTTHNAQQATYPISLAASSPANSPSKRIWPPTFVVWISASSPSTFTTTNLRLFSCCLKSLPRSLPVPHSSRMAWLNQTWNTTVPPDPGGTPV